MPRLPGTTAKKLVRFLKRHGFEDVRQSGSHLTLRKASSGATVTVPMHTGTDLGKGLVRRILMDAGIYAADFRP